MPAELSTVDEIWKPVPGWSSYEASSIGRVRSMDRVVEATNGQLRPCRGRILKPWIDRKGYYQVQVWAHGIGRTRPVHVLVLSAFAGVRPDWADCCCHNNGDRTDNRPSNLRWGTYSDNSQDRVLHAQQRDQPDRREPAGRQVCPLGHVLREPNLVQSHLRVGTRYCLSCNRARAFLASRKRRLGTEVTPELIKATADSYFVKLIAAQIPA